MHGIKQAHQITTGGSQPGSCGNISDGDNFDSVINMKKTEGFTGECVLNLFYMVDDLCFAVLDADYVIQNRCIHIEEHVLVNRNCENESAVFPVERREIGS